jgi:hypothetical protein
MEGLSDGAVGHTLWVLEILGLVVVVLAALIGGLVKGFRWLDTRIGERISSWSESKSFKAAVAEIVGQAFAATADLNNRMHEEHRRNFTTLLKRDEERMESVKRLHGRVDSLWERVGK